MPSTNIQWFPGHMAKTRKMIADNLKNVDIIIEMLDARVPYSSKNPEIARLKGNKPSIIVLNKADISDPEQNKYWEKYYTAENNVCITADCKNNNAMRYIFAEIKEILKDKTAKYEEKGMAGRRLYAMVVGIPNVGKSTLINRLSGGSKAKAEDRPGVTLNKQWISTPEGIDLLDMPGILWPKFEDKTVGENLAFTKAIKDEVTDIETVAMLLCGRLRQLYPDLLCARYNLGDISLYYECDNYDLLCAIGKKRGFLIRGGEVNTERTALVLLDEFRSGTIGKITLDRPEMFGLR